MINDTTFKGDGKVAYVPVVVNAKPPKQTHADRIRAMTDEELAEWIAGDALNLTGGSLAMATEAWLDWLKQEASDGED